MTLADILTFAFVASLLVISPGPNGVLIAKTVPTSGRRAGFANIVGFLSAFYLHGAFSIFGLSLLLTQSATAFAVLKYLGAAYLCWIGLKSLMEALNGSTASVAVAPARRARSLQKSFVEGFLTNALNPKVSMFYLAAFPQFIMVGGNTALTSLMLVTIHAFINAIWFTAMVLLLARLSAVSSGAGFQRWLKGVTGVVFLGFGAKLATLRASA
ncbi:MAG: LysE family transporter [Pseudomonadota bacterium]|nr:LysE family transporter [Pseudomonadota bacterium]